ncbi:MAG TPA: transcription termination factor NusA [Candidatus Babeliales bacterium]|nr:transcription termination factor NusA [Candidatus Babeliales bacterium]
MNLSDVISNLVEERGLDKATLDDIVCEGMLGAYQKKYPETAFKVSFDKNSGELEVFAEKEVVATVEDDDTQVSSRKAKAVETKSKAGDKIWVPFDGSIGRVEILKARQIIAQMIRAVESKEVYDAFKGKEGTIVVGTVHKCESGGALVMLQDVLAFLPNSLSIPGERCVPGYPIRALLKEVHEEPRGDNQLVLDRASPEFLRNLFELEIPEVFEKLVELKGVARAAGYKSKVVVASNDPNIDPVGTCVGVGGARIKPILKELGGEKIDIISWNSAQDTLVRDSLKPAEINRVEVVGDRVAKVWLDEDQRSVAIGRMGQNIRLASQITGLNIELVDSVKADDAITDVEFTDSEEK